MEGTKEGGSQEKEGRTGAHLVCRVDEVLDLGLRELAHAQQPAARRDLVAVTAANLRRRKRQAPAVEVEQVLEVHEDALGGLGAQVSHHVTARANRGPAGGRGGEGQACL